MKVDAAAQELVTGQSLEATQALEIVELLDYVLDTHEKTGNPLPIGSLKRSLSDLRTLIKIDNNHSGNGKVLSKDNIGVLSQELDNAQYPSAQQKTFDRKNGVYNRIKPIPAEVRGRVRELVDLISEDDQLGVSFVEN